MSANYALVGINEGKPSGRTEQVLKRMADYPFLIDSPLREKAPAQQRSLLFLKIQLCRVCPTF